MGLPRNLNVTQAALVSGRSTTTIYRWIASGFLRAGPRVRGKGFTIREADLAAANAKARKSTWGSRTPKRPWYANRLAAIRAEPEEQRDKRRSRMRQYYHRRKRPPGE